MELKEFIKTTIEQIVEGASAAQNTIASKGAILNPAGIQFQKDGAWNNYEHAMPQNIEFDVALTSVEKNGSAEGIGVFLGRINLGKKNENGHEHVAVTKVKFSIPIILPVGGKVNDFKNII